MCEIFIKESTLKNTLLNLNQFFLKDMLKIFWFYSNQPIILKNLVTTLIIVTQIYHFHLRKKRNDKLSSLDIEISWVKGKLVTTVSGRPTFSGDYTHFDSFLPYTHKFGMLYTLVHRCFTLCSDWSKFLRELMTLKENSKEMVIQRYLEIMFWRSF